MGISMSVKGLDKLIKIAEQYPAVSEKEINKAISRSLVRVLAQEKQTAPFGVSGMLRDNWKIELGRFEGRLYSSSKYAAAVEYGTAPHMPPVDELRPWANKKGINPWALAMSIKKKGTKANPFFKRAIDAATDGVNTEFKNALAAIKAALTSGTI